MQTYNAVKLAHFLLQPHLKKCRHAVDATAGNGWDSLFLAQNIPDDAVLYAFDVQASALKSTRELLCKYNVYNKVKLIEDSHENLSMHIAGSLDIVMFNLGYLPGNDHTITTSADSTVRAIKQALSLLNYGGFATVIAYPGHETGLVEYQQVNKLLKSLPTKNYAVNCWAGINTAKPSPILYVIEKIRSEQRESVTSREN